MLLLGNVESYLARLCVHVIPLPSNSAAESSSTPQLARPLVQVVKIQMVPELRRFARRR